jgi:hypothetical protein
MWKKRFNDVLKTVKTNTLLRAEGNMTFRKKVFMFEILGIMVMGTLLGLSACKSAASTTTPSPTTTGPTGGSVINSDSVITGTIKAIREQATGFPWEVDILVQSSLDVGTLPNPTKDSIGKVITVKTDQDMTSFKAGDTVSAKVKYVGDVPKPGITLYLYEVLPAPIY